MLRHARSQPLLLVLLLALILGGMLRFATLGQKSFWFDETFSIVEARKAQADIWRPREGRPESHPPLYYAGLNYWTRTAGESEASARLPSAVMSMLNIGLLYWLGRRLFDTKTASLAAVLLALSPINIWYAQETRMYVFVTAAGLAAALLLTWRSRWSMPLLTGVLTLGFYTSYSMFPLWTMISAFWFAAWWRDGRPRQPLAIWIASSTVAVLLFIPAGGANFLRVLADFDDVHIFIRLNETVGLPILAPIAYPVLLLVAGVILSVGAYLLTGWMQRPAFRRVFIWSVIAAFVASSLFFAVPRFYGWKRLLVQAWPFALLAVAWSLMHLGGRRWIVGTGLLTLSAVLCLWLVFGVPKDDWRGAAAYVLEQADQSSALVVLDPYWNTFPMRVYTPDLPVFEARRVDLDSTPASDIWLVAERFPGQAIPTSPSEAWLDTNRRLVETIPFHRLAVRRYAGQAEP